MAPIVPNGESAPDAYEQSGQLHVECADPATNAMPQPRQFARVGLGQQSSRNHATRDDASPLRPQFLPRGIFVGSTLAGAGLWGFCADAAPQEAMALKGLPGITAAEAAGHRGHALVFGTAACVASAAPAG